MNSTVTILTPYEITSLQGKERIRSRSRWRTSNQRKRNSCHVDAVIVNFGFVSSLGPIAEWGIEIQNGSILVDSRMETSIPGIFAAGDITTYPGKLKLIAVRLWRSSYCH